MNTFTDAWARYRAAGSNLVEPESSVLLGRATWAGVLVCTLVVAGIAVGLGTLELVQTFAVLEKDGTMPRSLTPPLDRTLLKKIANQFSESQTWYDAAVLAPNGVQDPSR